MFNFMDLTDEEVNLIMATLDEMPSKVSRALMNKLEPQIIQQVQTLSLTEPRLTSLN